MSSKRDSFKIAEFITYDPDYSRIPFRSVEKKKNKKTGEVEEKIIEGRIGVAAAIMLIKAIWWTKICWGMGREDGVFYKTAAEWEKETGLTPREQETARRNLRGTKFWKEQLKRSSRSPTELHFQIIKEQLDKALELSDESEPVQKPEKSPGVIRQKRESRFDKSAKLVSTKCRSLFRQNVESHLIKQRIHAENTAEITSSKQQAEISSLSNPEPLPAAAKIIAANSNDEHLSRFSIALIEQFCKATKPHAKSIPALARAIWKSGADDDQIERWQQQQAGKQSPPPAEMTEEEIDAYMSEEIERLIEKRDFHRLADECEEIRARGGAKKEWEIRAVAFFDLHRNDRGGAC